MAEFRYETRCGGRLLKVIEQVEVPDFPMDYSRADLLPGQDLRSPYPTAEAAAEATAAYRAASTVPVVDGQWWWMVDEHRVADDVARAMLAEYGDQP